MKQSIFLTLITATVLLLPACESDREKTSGQTKSSSDTTAVQTYEAAGKVISILPNRKNFIVKHGDIPGFMDAMTMPFSVRDTSALSNISPQDSIHFIIKSESSDIFVTEIQKVETE